VSRLPGKTSFTVGERILLRRTIAVINAYIGSIAAFPITIDHKAFPMLEKAAFEVYARHRAIGAPIFKAKKEIK
jgi:hypothetical protein